MKLLHLAASSLLVGSLGAIAIACSSTPDSASADGACAQYASAYRAYTQKCATSGSISTSDARWNDLEGRMRTACGSALSLQGTGVTPAVLTGCANAVKTASCTTRADDLPQCDFPAGTLADGAACSSGEQCASRSCKKTSTETGSAPCGVCQPRVAVGADCSTNPSCVENAMCDFATKKCIAMVRNGVGGSCDSAKGESCLSGLYCDFTVKVCKERGAAGATCSSTAPCQTTLTCNATSKTCTAPTPAGEGQACGTATAPSCSAGLRCDSTSRTCIKIVWVAPGGDCSATGTSCERGGCSATTKKCPVVIADGQACLSDRSTGVCDDFASCIDGKCTLPGQVVCK